MPTEVIRPRELEGRAIRQNLKELLSSRGTNAPRGGDYYIVESDVGTYEQKVLMFWADLFDSEMRKATSEILRDYSSAWRVLFLGTDEGGIECDPPVGVRVGASNTNEISIPISILSSNGKTTERPSISFRVWNHCLLRTVRRTRTIGSKTATGLCSPTTSMSST
jgi:hypothetical protein